MQLFDLNFWLFSTRFNYQVILLRYQGTRLAHFGANIFRLVLLFFMLKWNELEKLTTLQLIFD